MGFGSSLRRFLGPSHFVVCEVGDVIKFNKMNTSLLFH